MEVRELICSHDEHRAESDRFIAETRAQLGLKPTDSLIDAVIFALAQEFDAYITDIAVDQWFGVHAKDDDRSLSVVIECDAVEVGFAGVYRAFARHAKIKAILAAVPGAKWEYAPMGDPEIGAWSLDNPPNPTERVVLQRDGNISWNSKQERDGSQLWKACLEANFR